VRAEHIARLGEVAEGALESSSEVYRATIAGRQNYTTHPVGHSPLPQVSVCAWISETVLI